MLLVEDEPDIRLVARLALQQGDIFRVVEAHSGRMALDLLRQACPDVVLLDVMMPEMDGPSLVRELRRDPGTAEIPVIFLTAKAAGEDLRDLRALGVAGIITKPFDPATLAAEVRALLAASTPGTLGHAERDAELQPVVNEGTLRRLDGLTDESGRDVRHQLIDMFASHSPHTLERTRAILVAGSETSGEAARLMHTLKGSAATLGLEALAGQCRCAEELIAQGQHAEAVAVVERMAASLPSTVEALRAAGKGPQVHPVSHPGNSS